MRTARAFILVFAAALTAAFAACENPDTQTPTCTNNVDKNGINTNSPNGCEQVAVCSLGSAQACCMAADQISGNDLATCLHGYGDSSCTYLWVQTTNQGTNMIFTCMTTPQPPGTGMGGGGTGGSGAGGGGGGATSSSVSSTSGGPDSGAGG